MVLTYRDAPGSPGKSTPDSDIVEGRFIELLPGVRVVYAVGFVSDDPAYVGTMTMTWEVTAVEVDSVAGRSGAVTRRCRPLSLLLALGGIEKWTWPSSSTATTRTTAWPDRLASFSR